MPTTPVEFAPWLGVFETLRVVRGVPLFVAEHYAELMRAAAALGLAVRFDPAKAQGELPRAESGRWRWIVTPEGTHTLFSREDVRPPSAVEIAVSPVRVGSANWDARFKTVSYLAHAQARRMAATPEVVLLNEHGHVASAASANIFWRKGERLFTPAHEAGCRCGVMREFVLWREKAEAGHFLLGEVMEADEIFLTNSLRGIVSVTRIEDRAVLGTATADRLRKAYDDMVARALEDKWS
jgi:branched-subunit amino acid aminotransferase/4-amino-4-deoxychorismate lyase